MRITTEISEFKKRAFVRDYQSIEIRQCSSADPLIFNGSGYVRQESDGTILLKCYAEIPDQLADIGSMMNFMLDQKSGLLYSDDEYFDARMRGFGSIEWRAGMSLASFSTGGDSKKIIVTMSPRMLSASETVGKPSSELRLTFARQELRHWTALLGKPHTIHLASLPMTFELDVQSTDSGEIEIRACSQSGFPDEFRVRLVEALQFITALSLWSVCYEQFASGERTVELWADPRGVRHQAPLPPLTMRHTKGRAAVLNLFACYLDLTVREAEAGLVHRCSALLHSIRQSQQGSIEAEAVSLCVAAEGISRLLPEFSKPEVSADLRKARGVLLEALGSGDFEKSTKDRVKGLLSKFSEPRAKDVMLKLVSSGRVVREDVIAWESLRHSSVHSTKRRVPAGTPDDTELVVENMYKTLRLIYGMIFGLIGYAGPCIDYGSNRFPERQFPFDR
jgi:hypothetical protein